MEHRTKIYHDLNMHYFFDLGNTDLTIDPFQYGNKLRFLNHAKNAGLNNCGVRNVFSKGTLKIALFSN